MTNPDRVAFTLFGRDVYWYGVLMALGIVIAVWLALKEARRKGITEDDMLDMILVLIPSGVVGARLYYVLFELDYYLQNPISILYVWEGGLAIYGAVIGGLLGVSFCARHKKIRFRRFVDCIAPGLVLAQAIGRWGNFFNQEAFGLPVTNSSMMWFPLAVRIDGYHLFDGAVCANPYHLATFFYESMWCLLVFAAIWVYRKKFKHDGDAFLTYALLYSFERMFIEGLRGDSLYLLRPAEGFAGVRVSQLLSFLLFAAILAFFLVRRSREKKLGRLIWPAPEAALAAEAEAAEGAETAEEAEAETAEESEAEEQLEDAPAEAPQEQTESEEQAEQEESDKTE